MLLFFLLLFCRQVVLYWLIPLDVQSRSTRKDKPSFMRFNCIVAFVFFFFFFFVYLPAPSVWLLASSLRYLVLRSRFEQIKNNRWEKNNHPMIVLERRIDHVWLVQLSINLLFWSISLIGKGNARERAVHFSASRRAWSGCHLSEREERAFVSPPHFVFYMTRTCDQSNELLPLFILIDSMSRLNWHRMSKVKLSIKLILVVLLPIQL